MHDATEDDMADHRVCDRARIRKTDVLTSRAIVPMLALMVISLTLVMLARATNFGVLRHAPSVAVETRAILFEDREDGSLAIYDAGASRPFEVIPKDGSGFVHGTMRALKHGRRVNQASPSTPFELVRWADGRFSLRDTKDGREIALEAFGPTNAAAFRRILELKGAT
jgi:putative photosynthetic complex assembly protein